MTEPRTRVEMLLMELLYQILTTETSSNVYVESRLRKAGLTENEIKKIMNTELGGC